MRLLVLLSFIIVPLDLFAQEWVATDPRTKGTGNSGVAYQDDGSKLFTAQFMNPAYLGHDIEMTSLSTLFKLARVELGVYGFADLGVEGNALKAIDSIADLFQEQSVKDIQNRLNSGNASASDIQTIYKILEDAAELDEDGSGAFAWFGYAADIRLGNVVIGYRETIFAGLDPVVDLSLGANASLADGGVSEVLNTIGTTNSPSTSAGQSLSSKLQSEAGLTKAQADELAFHAEQSGVTLSESVQNNITSVVKATEQGSGQISSGATFENNKSGITLNGLWLRELDASVGAELPFLLDNLAIGTTLRFLEGTTFTKSVFFNSVKDSSDLQDDLTSDFDESKKTQAGFTIDIGASYEVFEDFLAVSLVGKNLIPNSFDYKTEGSFDLRPQARTGILVQPFGSKLLKFVGDLDLTKNEFDGFDGYESRIIGGGVEFAPNIWLINLAIRAGVYTNMLSEDNAIIYTAGLSLRFLRFLSLDLSGQVSSEKSTIENPSGGSSDKDVPNRAGAALALTLYF